MKLVENFNEFAKSTSIHGFEHMTSPSSSKLKRLIWVLLFTGAMIYAEKQISSEAKCKYCKTRLVKVLQYL